VRVAKPGVFDSLLYSAPATAVSGLEMDALMSQGRGADAEWDDVENWANVADDNDRFENHQQYALLLQSQNRNANNTRRDWLMRLWFFGNIEKAGNEQYNIIVLFYPRIFLEETTSRAKRWSENKYGFWRNTDIVE